MMAALRAELLRLRLVTVAVAVVAVTLIVGGMTVLIWATLPTTAVSSQEPSLVPSSISGFEGSLGLTTVLKMTTPHVGLILMVLTIWSIGSEYRHGTWGHLLTRQPHRAVVLAGKFAGAVLMAVVLVGVAVAVAVGSALVMADSRDLAVSSWLTAGTAGDVLITALRALLVVITYALVGAAVALVTRSVGAATALALSWFFVLEPVVSAVLSTRVPALAAWLPKTILDTVAWGSVGTGVDLSETAAAWRTVLMAVVIGAFSLALFERRDILQGRERAG